MAASLDGITTLPTLRLPVSLPTGTRITPPIGSSYSQLTVKNGNPVDAVFKLVDVNSGQILRFMYVQANEDLTVERALVAPSHLTEQWAVANGYSPLPIKIKGAQ